MTTLILMRHGETISNIKQIYQGRGDGVLSTKGKQQARAAAKYFSKIKIDAFFSSILGRSYDTAKIIAKNRKTRIVKIKGLCERYYGAWEGLRFDEIEKRYRKLYKLWLKDPNKAIIPHAETLRELQKRGVSAVKKIVSANNGKTILAVGHGGINRAIICHYLGLDLNNWWKMKQDNCCHNIIKFQKPYPRVVLLNSACYLGESRLTKKNVLS